MNKFKSKFYGEKQKKILSFKCLLNVHIFFLKNLVIHRILEMLNFLKKNKKGISKHVKYLC